MEQIAVSNDSLRDDEIFSLVERIKELGYANVSGRFKEATDSEEAELLLAIETILAKKEQRKIIESPFVR